MSAANPTAAEIEDYLADEYGRCAKGSAWCYHGGGCLKTGWKGRGCPNWIPMGWKTFADIGSVGNG